MGGEERTRGMEKRGREGKGESWGNSALVVGGIDAPAASTPYVTVNLTVSPSLTILT